MFGPRMPRGDRRMWAEARTLGDLGELMALWLEGKISSRPGYQPRCGPDEETQHLIPTLAALNRAGFLTDSSQPGINERGFDGSWWEQRAWVEGFLADDRLLGRLTRAARAAGAEVLVDSRQSIAVTTVDGQPATTGGGRIPAPYLRLCWGDLHRDAYAAIKRAKRLTIAHRTYGAEGERLWPALRRAVR